MSTTQVVNGSHPSASTLPDQGRLPTEINHRWLMPRIFGQLEGVEGWLSYRETRCLATLAALPTTQGSILEIGSFRGRSTIALALAEQYARRHLPLTSPITAVDPLLDVDPGLGISLTPGSAKRTIERNLVRAGVRGMVDLREAFSYDVAPQWTQPLRLLWIDGDHSYPAAKRDFDLFFPYLADGAMLAMHDVLSPYEGATRVFCEQVLASPYFTAAGLCGSIGWAQFRHQPLESDDDRRDKWRLLNRLKKLIPYHRQPQRMGAVRKLRYKWLRWRVPHRRLQLDGCVSTISSAF